MCEVPGVSPAHDMIVNGAGRVCNLRNRLIGGVLQFSLFCSAWPWRLDDIGRFGVFVTDASACLPTRIGGLPL